VPSRVGIPGLPVFFSNPETLDVPKLRLSGLFSGKHLRSIPCSCHTKILHLGARDERKSRRSRMV